MKQISTEYPWKIEQSRVAIYIYYRYTCIWKTAMKGQFKAKMDSMTLYIHCWNVSCFFIMYFFSFFILTSLAHECERNLRNKSSDSDSDSIKLYLDKGCKPGGFLTWSNFTKLLFLQKISQKQVQFSLKLQFFIKFWPQITYF